jgi:hypothetical protein
VSLFALLGARQSMTVASAQLVARFAARASADLRVDCVFDIGCATIVVPAPCGACPRVYIPGSVVAVSARRRVEDFADRLRATCGTHVRVVATTAEIAPPAARLEGCAASADLVAIAACDFHEMSRWFRVRKPADHVRKRQTPFLVVGPGATTLADGILVTDVETRVSDIVEGPPYLIREAASTLARASQHVRGAAPWDWVQLESAADTAKCDTIAVRVPRGWSVPFLGKRAKLCAALRNASVSAILS